MDFRISRFLLLSCKNKPVSIFHALIFAALALIFGCKNQPYVAPPKPIHFRVNALEGTAVDGQVAVFWRQLNNDGSTPDPLLLRQEFFKLAPTVDVGFPTFYHANNESIAVGTIAVFEDSNGNGVVDADDKAYGLAHMVIVFSPSEQPFESLVALKSIFPQGVKGGTNLYDAVLNGDLMQLIPVSWETVFDLYVCSSPGSVGSGCNLPSLPLF